MSESEPELKESFLAAVKIQCFFRRLTARRHKATLSTHDESHKKEIAQQSAAAIIQALVRGVLCRKKLQEAKNGLPSTRELEAAELVQTFLRSAVEQRRKQRAVESRKEAWKTQREEDAVSLLQRWWHRRKFIKAFCRTSGVLDSAVTATKSQEAAHDEVSVHQERQYAAYLIQAGFFARFKWRKVIKGAALLAATEEEAAIEQEKYYINLFASRIQTLGMRRRSQRRVLEARREREEAAAQLRREEAHAVLVRMYCRIAARHAAQQRAVVREEERQEKLHSEAATRIQASYKGYVRRQNYLTELAVREEQRRNRNAAKIQALQRGHAARLLVKRLLLRRAAETANALLHESATTIQRMRRGHVVRRQVRYIRGIEQISNVAHRIGRAYLERMKVSRHASETRAAVRLQRNIRPFLARGKLRQRRAAEENRRKDEARTQAAILVQRNWKVFQAGCVLEDLREEREFEQLAASIIQRQARMLVARVQLKRLKLEQQQKDFEQEFTQSVVLVQSTVHRFLARLLTARIREERRRAQQLLVCVVGGFVARRHLSQAREMLCREVSATKIQSFWHERKFLEHEKAHAIQKRIVLKNKRICKNAAVQIQRLYKGYKQSKLHRHISEQRCTAALALQQKMRQFLAKMKLHLLQRRQLENMAAKKIQLRWEECKETVKECRIQREMEKKLLDMEYIDIFRSETFHRSECVGEEEGNFVSLKRLFKTTAQELQDKENARVEAWKKRSPFELQVVAAIKIQAVYRGYRVRAQSRLRAKIRAGEQLIPRGLDAIAEDARDLLPMRIQASVQSAAATATALVPAVAEEEGVEGEDTLTVTSSEGARWLSWLAKRPTVSKRCFERLLQREVASRRRIVEEYEALTLGLPTTVTSGIAREEITQESRLPPLLGNPSHRFRPGYAARHLTALASAEEVSRRANDALSLHPTTLSTSVTVSRICAPQGQQALSMFEPDAEGRVDFSKSRLTEAILRPLLHSLRNNARLRTLILDGVLVRDMSAVDIADLLNHTSTLSHLSLANTSLSDVGLSHLIAALRRNRSLETIDISGTCVTERYRQHLHQVMTLRPSKVTFRRDGALPPLPSAKGVDAAPRRGRLPATPTEKGNIPSWEKEADQTRRLLE